MPHGDTWQKIKQSSTARDSTAVPMTILLWVYKGDTILMRQRSIGANWVRFGLDAIGAQNEENYVMLVVKQKWHLYLIPLSTTFCDGKKKDAIYADPIHIFLFRHAAKKSKFFFLRLI